MRKKTAELLSQVIPEPEVTKFDIPTRAVELLESGILLSQAYQALRAVSAVTSDNHKLQGLLRTRAQAFLSEAAIRLKEAQDKREEAKIKADIAAVTVRPPETPAVNVGDGAS